MKIIGLTGSIGMGKSTVARMFAEAGVPVFDADAAVHALYAGEAAAPVEAAFPGVTAGGVVDRAMLGARVLGNGSALEKLESIVHPLVKARQTAFLEKARQEGARLAVLDVPLLLENGGDKACDLVAVVSAPLDVQKARVLAREGMTEERFQSMVSRQMPDAEKRRRADVVIDTGGALHETEAAVRALILSHGGVSS
jgi:dephospho-CoA kinase